MKKLLFLFTLLFISVNSFSQVPKYIDWVSDYEKIFTPEQNKQISKMLSDYEKETTIEIKVLTVNDYEGDIFDLAQETAETWGVGKKDIDNGLLIVLSKNKKVLRSQTGYGLEGYLPDGWLKHTGDSISKADFSKGRYYEGLVAFIGKCKGRIGKEGYSEEHNEELIKENKKDDSILGWMLEHIPWYVWPLIIIGWVILYFICPNCALILLYIVTAGKGGKGGSGGGGGFGGGGSTSRH